MRKEYNILLCLLMITSIGFTQFRSKNSSQNKAENAVAVYLSEVFKESTYTPYTFGDLIKIIPTEITEVELLKKKRDSLYCIDSSSVDALNLNKKINDKVNLIKENKLHTIYEIDHFYTVKELIEKPTLYHSVFTLYPDGKVKNVVNELVYKFIDNEADYYYRYYRRSPLIIEADMEDRQYNIQTYAFLDELYLNETVDKEAAMSTILSTIQTISSTGYYDTTLLARIVVSKNLKRNKDVSNFKDISFSSVQPIKDSSNALLGYKLFVLFENKDKEKEMLYFEFDYNYIIRNTLVVEPPYEPYLKQ